MASFAALTAAETANAAADIPLLGVNAIPITPSVQIWSNADEASVGGETGGTDRTDSVSPVRRSHDGKTEVITKPGTSPTDDVFYLVFDMIAAGIEFDFAAIGAGHNLGTIGATSIILQASTLGDFSTKIDGTGGGPSDLCDFGAPSDDNRLAQMALFHTGAVALRYSAVRFLRLEITGPGAIIPEISELWIARRRQLWGQSLIPHADDNLTRVFAATTGTSGIVSQRNDHQRRFDIEHRLISSDATEIADLKAFYRECGGPFIYMPEPDAAPEEFRGMMLRSQYRNPGIAAARLRRHALVGIEQGPERHYVDVELNG